MLSFSAQMKRYTKSIAIYSLMAVISAACFQIKEKRERFTVNDSVYAPNVLTAIQRNDSLLVGGFEAEEFEINAETTSQLVEIVVNQWHKAGYTQTKTAYRPWGELGIKLYGDFARSLDSHQPLSASIRKNYLQYDPQAKYLLHVIIQSQKNRQAESAIRYTNTQAISVDYRLWDLTQGDIIFDIQVQGFSSKSNEKHLTEQTNFGKSLLEDVVFSLAYDGMPESVSLPSFIEKTTLAFLQRFEKLSTVTK